MRSIRIAFLACGRWNGLVPLQTEKMGAHVSLRNLCLAIRTFAYQTSFAYFTLLQPTGCVMHHQFNIQQLYALPTLYLCVLYLSENKQRLVPLTA